MHQSLFLSIAKVVEEHDPWFTHMRNASGEICASPLMKCVVVVLVLDYGCSVDAIDNYVRIGKILS